MELPPDISAMIGTVEAVAPLESGATSDVWRLDTKDTVYVFKQIKRRRPSNPLAVDADIRRRVKSGVATPVAHGDGWALDEFVKGAHPERGRIPAPACRALGVVLARLHAIEARGFGRPALSPNGEIVGQQSTPLAGLNTRYSDPVPEAPQQNPALRHAPALAKALSSYLAKLRAALQENRAALCHSDLHERQVLLHNNHLAALLDFGDVTIADPRWDLGSLLYFHGPEVVKNMLGSYGAGTLTEACLFSIGIALHHANRSLIEGKEHRLAIATAHLHKAHMVLSSKKGTG